jgi:type IV pilus assembly protein PilC
VVAGLRTDRGRNIRDTMLLKAPVIGDLVQHSILERFCRILASMVSAGVPLPDALTTTSNATNNYVFRSRLRLALDAMLRGEGLAAPLAATGLFPAAARQMFTVGESTGSLDEQLGIAATYFDRELDYKLKRFTDLFEPAVLIGVGLVVGFVAIALVSAMYGIFRQVHQ